MPRDNLPLQPKHQPPHTQAADWVMTACNQLERAKDAIRQHGPAIAAIEHVLVLTRELESALRSMSKPEKP